MTARYFFSAEADRVDRARVHLWLSEQSYWAQGRVRAKQDAAIDASRNYGGYEIGTGEQIAYARVVTDGVTFAWLCDVFVATEARGHGIGKMIAAGVVEDLEPLERSYATTPLAYDYGSLQPCRVLARTSRRWRFQFWSSCP